MTYVLAGNIWLLIMVLPFNLKIIFSVFLFFNAPQSRQKHVPSAT